MGLISACACAKAHVLGPGADEQAGNGVNVFSGRETLLHKIVRRH